MKGKVDSVTTKQETRTLTSLSQKFDVRITITVKDKLSYGDSEKLLEKLSEEYLGKEVDIEHHKEPFPL